MTSLADKVARVINELDHAEGMAAPHPNHEGMETSMHFEGLLLEAKKLLVQLWDENQKQREVLGMAREALLDVLGAAMFDRPEIHRRIGKETLTAIDNVMKGA